MEKLLKAQFGIPEFNLECPNIKYKYVPDSSLHVVTGSK